MELLGTQEAGVYRFKILEDMLDKNNISVNESNQIIIPINRPIDSFLYDDVFEVLLKQVNENYDIDKDQTPNLELIINDMKQFMFGASIETAFEDTYVTINIHLSNTEIENINQILYVDFLRLKNQKIKAG